MRHLFIIVMIVASAFCAWAQDAGAVVEYAEAELPVIQLCAVEDSTENPVALVTISVEYADTIIVATTDEMGLLDFTPRSLPFTLKAKCEGMQEVSYGVLEQPEGPLTITLTREPAKEEEPEKSNQ